jgi:hypothetical protein
VGTGVTRKGLSATKKYMWKEKIELHWRIQGQKVRAELYKEVIGAQNN